MVAVVIFVHSPKSDIITAGTWCALVSFQLVAHVPIFVIWRAGRSWRICKTDELEVRVCEQVRLYRHLQCMSIRIPRWHRTHVGTETIVLVCVVY